MANSKTIQSQGSAVKGILGKKLGMTQVFDANNKIVPVTVVEAGPCVVTQVKSSENDGYTAIQLAFGENYIQEAVDKMAALSDLTLEWHCIGPIQSNKTQAVASNFDWVHSVDRLKIAQRLSEQRPAHLPPLQVCLQVNIDGGPTKAGVAPAEALALAQAVVALPRLALRGFMTIPDPVAGFDAQVALHAQAKRLFDELQTALGLPHFDTLSMGMSADLEAAIQAGSTMVRVGTAVFGAR